MAEDRKNKNPFQYFWEMATGGLFSAGSDIELTPDEKAGTKRKNKPQRQKNDPEKKAKHTHIDSSNRKKAG